MPFVSSKFAGFRKMTLRRSRRARFVSTIEKRPVRLGSRRCMLAAISAKGTRMHNGHAQYLPIAPSLFALLAVALGILLILVQIRVLRYAYMQHGVSSGTAFLLLFGSLLGSYVNIPIATLGVENMVTDAR